MRRVLLTVVATLLVLTSACTSEQRPEGVTERWLLSLNQGAAGRPDRFAPEEVSQAIVPGWHDLEPGAFGVIEVEPRIATGTGDATASVPFRLVSTDGVETHGVAALTLTDGTWQVTSAELSTTAPADGAPFGAGLTGWPIALAVGALLALAALGLLAIVQRRAIRT